MYPGIVLARRQQRYIGLISRFADFNLLLFILWFMHCENICVVNGEEIWLSFPPCGNKF